MRALVPRDTRSVEYTFDAVLWSERDRREHYTHLTVPQDITDEILEIAEGLLRGWRSVRVEASIGTTSFRTSIFPYPNVDGYILPVKRAVRSAERLEEGDSLTVTLRLVDF